MKISISKFKMSAVVCTGEFITFAHFFGIYKNAEKRKYEALSGKPKFCYAEMDNAVKTTQKKYEDAVNVAIGKLFKLDALFYKNTKEHIIVRLNNFEEFVEVLEEIDKLINVED